MTLSGIRKMLFAAPLLAGVAAWALPSTNVEAAADSTATADATNADADATADATADSIALVVNNCTYYNNASHSQVVGQFGYDCCNNPVSWGKKTRFSQCGGCFPCIPPPQ